MLLSVPCLPLEQAPKVVMGPGTGLGAAQLIWDQKHRDYQVVPGDGPLLRAPAVPQCTHGW